jgi:hypothetical protein
MAGVEILNQIPVTETEIGIGFGWLMVIAIAIFGAILGFFAIFDMEELGLVLGAVVAVGVATAILCFTEKEFPTGEYQYEVIIEEKVNLHEFYDHYDIIEQRGEIFVVQEKSSE